MREQERERHRIDVRIHLTNEEEILAYGTVTVDQCIRFGIQMRSYIDKDGGEKSFLSFPRREGKYGWENVIRPDRQLRDDIMEAVGEAIKQEITKDVVLPEIESVEVTPILTMKKYQTAKAYICGMATVKVCGLTIHGIAIKKSEKGVFINMPQYRNEKGYHDIVYGTSKAMQEKIQQAVLETYEQFLEK